MTRALTPFIFEQRSIRVVTDCDGEPLFVGKDVADALGYADSTTAIRSHCKGVQKLHPLQTSGGMQHVRVLAEPDVLRLIVSSTLPSADAFERWVFEEVLPSIRKTGRYVAPAKQMSPAEMFLQNAQMMVDLERTQAEQGVAIQKIESRVDQIADRQVMATRPTNSESIVHIRARINKQYGLSSETINEVMRQSVYAPKPAHMVKNSHENAQGGTYAVYWIKDVSAVFARFVSECERQTATQFTHPFIVGRFKLNQETHHA